MDVLKTMEEKAFWGHDFLTWLWFLSETTGGEVDLEGFGPVAFWIEEHLVLEGPASTSKQNIIKTGDVANCGEAAAALADGKKVTRARFGMRIDELQWSFTLDAMSLDLKSMKIPPVEAEEEDGDDPEALVLLRMGMVRRCLDALDGLFTRYARLRIGGDWESTTLGEMERWIEEKA